MAYTAREWKYRGQEGAFPANPLNMNVLELAMQSVHQKADELEVLTDELSSKVNGIFINVKEFGAVGDGVTDDTQAIQNAINSIGGGNNRGTVYFPFGQYLLSSSIFMTHGVSLDGCGSLFIPKLTGVFTEDYMFIHNSTDGLNWTAQYSNRNPFFRNCRFWNMYDKSGMKCLFFASGMKISNIFSGKMFQTLKKVYPSYVDMVDIDTIHVYDPKGEDYHLDLGYNGDNLNVSNVHMHGESGASSITNKKLLKVRACNGGNISRIINGSILIIESYALKISECHIEWGTIEIENSAVSLENIAHYYYNETPLLIRGEESGWWNENSKRPSYIKNYAVIYNPVFTDISDETFDAHIENACVSIDGFYRATYSENSCGDSQQYGVRITKNGTDEHVFNDYSAMNSLKSVISNDRMLNHNFLVDINNISIASVAESTINYAYPENPWADGAGTYYYLVQALADKDRLIGTETAESSIVVGENSNGVIVTLSGNLDSKWLKLYYGYAPGVYDYTMTIPCLMGNYFYDGGANLCGFRWAYEVDMGVDDINTQFSKVEVKGDNVICHGSGTPSYGTWKTGDKIYNDFSISDDYVGWVCTVGGTPGTWLPFGATVGA